VYGVTQAMRFGGEGERALALLARYLDSADPWTGAAARLQSADILRDLGRIEEAASYCDTAPAVFRDIEESWGTAITLTFRAELDKTAGDYRGAIAALEEAAAASRQLANSSDLAWLYRQLAGLRVRTGDYPAAHAVLDLADRSVWAQGNWGRLLRLIRAELAWREGQLAEATRLCEAILRDEADRPAFWWPLRALAGARLGVLTLEAGDVARGTELLRDALAAAAAGGDRPTAATATEGLAAAALRTERPSGRRRCSVPPTRSAARSTTAASTRRLPAPPPGSSSARPRSTPPTGTAAACPTPKPSSSPRRARPWQASERLPADRPTARPLGTLTAARGRLPRSRRVGVGEAAGPLKAQPPGDPERPQERLVVAHHDECALVAGECLGQVPG
jgi:hypothetical protein